MKKRIISMMLVLVMSFTLIGQMTFGVEAKTAAYMTEEEAFAAGLDVYTAWYNIYQYDSYEEFSKISGGTLPHERLYNTLMESTNWQDNLYKFKGTLDEDSKLALYETVLFQMLLSDSNSLIDYESVNGTNVSDILANGYAVQALERINSGAQSIGDFVDDASVFKGANEFISYLKDSKKALANNTAIPKLTDDGKKFAAEMKARMHFDPGDITDGIMGVANGLLTIWETQEDIEQAQNTLTKFYSIWGMSESYYDVMLQMSEESEIKATAESAEFAAAAATALWKSYYDSSYRKEVTDKLNNTGWEHLESYAKDYAKDVIAEVAWAAACAAFPAVTFIKIGVSVTNIVTKFVPAILDAMNHDYNEALYALEVLKGIESRITTAVAILRNRFIELHDAESARAYNTAVKMWYRFIVNANEYSSSYLSVFEPILSLETTGIVRKMINNTNNQASELMLAYDYNAIQSYYRAMDTYSAKWILYDANGGTGVPTPQVKRYADPAITIDSFIPQKAGYIFKGWALNPTSNTIAYRPGDAYRENKDITLYAVWELGTFPVYFDANGGQYSDGTTSVMRTKTYNVPLTMDIPQPTRGAEYEFLGWSENPKSATPDEKFNAPQVGSIGGNNLNEKHVYAVWCKNTATITYDYGIGRFDPYTTTVKEPLSKGTGQHLIGNPLAHNKSGEDTLLNWYYYKGSEKVYCNIDETVAINGDLYLYANWQSPRPQPTISVKSDKTVYKPGESVKLSISIDKSDHFYIDVAGLPGAVVDGGSALFVERTSPAAAGHRNYDNGTTVTEYIDIPSNCSDGLYDIEIRASNSVLDSEGTGNVDNERPVIETVRIKVQRNEIVEEKDMYTVSFDLNGGAGSAPEPLRGEDGSSVYLPDCKMTLGFEFAGWCTKANGKGTIYDAGERYTIRDNITLYAIWEPKSGPLDVRIENNPKIYEPGDVANISVDLDYADHFYFDISGNTGFTIKSKDGDIYTNGASFWNVDSEDYIPGETGFADNKSVMMYVYIPDDCRDGDYTFKVTATSARWDPVTHKVPAGSPMVEKYTTIHVRSTDNADSVELSRDHVTVHVGSRKTIKATIYPDIYNKTKAVYWSTDNRRIASIYDEGDLWVKIEGERVGTTYITGEVDNASATCEIEVVECDYCNKEIDPDYLASAATCTERARYYYVCDCGNVGDETYEYGNLVDHEYTDWTVTVEPDEYTVGIKTRKCINCDKVESLEIPALGHTHDLYDQWFYNDTHHWHECRSEKCYEKLDMAEHVFTDENDLICDCGYEREPVHTHEFENDWSMDADYHWYECSCGEISDKEAHMWDDGKVTTESTETSEGVETFTCTTCGKTKTESIPKKEHDHNYGDEWLNDETNHWHECKCGDKADVEAHTYIWTVEKEATEEAEGLEKGICSICGYETTRAIPKKDHEHNYGDEWLNDETNHWHECKCGEKTDIAAHTYNWTVEKEATEDAEGLEKGICSICGYETTRAIPKKDHVHEYGSELLNDETNHWHECKCGDKADVEAHTYNWTVEKEATEEAEGLEKGICSICGYETTRVIPKKDHVHEYGNEWLNDETNHWHECKCGDKVDVEEHILKEVIDTAPTEDSDGVAHDECEVCGLVTNEGKVIPALEHIHTMAKVEAKAATCIEEGNIEYYTCTKCHKNFADEFGENEVENVVVDKDPFNHIGGTRVDGNIESDCSNVGYTGDTVCVSCGVIIIKGEIVPTNGNHDYEWKVDVEPTIEEPGLKHEECTRCGDRRSENTEIPKMGCAHSNMQHFDKIPSTCSMQGICEYWYCFECGGKYTDEKGILKVESDAELLLSVDPENHITTEIRYAVAATCSSTGYSGDTYCNDCQKTVAHGTVTPIDPKAHSFRYNRCDYCLMAQSIYYPPTYTYVDDNNHMISGRLEAHTPDFRGSQTDGVYEWHCCRYCLHNYGKILIEDSTVVEVEEPVESGSSESIPDVPVTGMDISEPVQDNNPHTGIVIALLPMALAMAAAIASKRPKK